MPWNVETKSLEEKCEADPLIIFVISELIIVRMTILHSVMCLGAPVIVCHTERKWLALHCQYARSPEGGVDPAVGVHYALGDLLNDAVDWIPDVSLRGHQGAGRQQNHKGGLDTQEMSWEITQRTEKNIMSVSELNQTANTLS